MVAQNINYSLGGKRKDRGRDEEPVMERRRKGSGEDGGRQREVKEDGWW